MVNNDLLVVGLDIATDTEVMIDDAPIATWRSKSYRRGDSSLICLHCFQGFDAPPGTLVPLVVKHRDGGSRRAHFAHPPGMAPPHGHAPETLWHSEAKHALARWAAALPNVASATTERFTLDRARRSDIMVILNDGTRLALELQYRLLHDDDWRARHADYQANGIIDIWLWRHTLPTPWMVNSAGCAMWLLDLPRRSIGTLWGQAHARNHSWHTHDDLGMYAPHLPPCRHDATTYRARPWNEFDLGNAGLKQPASWLAEQEHRLTQVHEEAAHLRRQHREPDAVAKAERVQSSAPTSATDAVHRQPERPKPTVTADSAASPTQVRSPGRVRPSNPWDVPKGVKVPLCHLCKEKLAPLWWDSGTHLDCEQELLKSRRPQRPRRR